MQKEGSVVTLRTLDDISYLKELQAKLVEEAAEVPVDDRLEALKELADLQEAIDCMVTALQSTTAEIKALQAIKRESHGSFEARRYIETVTVADDCPWVDHYTDNSHRYPEIISQNLEAQTIATYDTYAESWALEHNDRAEYKELIKRFKRLLPTGSILEVGAGGGSDARLLSDNGYEYYGTDASQGMIAIARQMHPDLIFDQLSVYDLADIGRHFDGFWACAVLLHIPKSRIDEALQSISGVVKHGGIGFVSIKDGHDELFERRQKQDRDEKRLFAYWTKDEFTDALQRNGFETVGYEYSPKSERTNWHRFFVRKT